MTYVPRLNRIVTIRASSVETAESLIPWRYSHYGAEMDGESVQPVTTLPSVGKYAWSASLLGSHDFSDVDTSAKLTSATVTELELAANSVNPDGSPNSNLPEPGDVLRDETLTGKEVRVGPASLYPDSYVSFTAGGRNDYFANDSKFEQFFFIEVDGSITHTGDAFTLEIDDDVIVTVQDQTAQQSIADSAEYWVWCELAEMGVSQSIQSSGSLLTTSREQTGFATIRYDSRLLVAETLTDDLGREWRVTSSRPLNDRRFLRFELSLDLV